MKKYFLLIISFILFLLWSSCKDKDITNLDIDRIKGISFVAPPNNFRNNPMPSVKAANIEWISVIPFGWTKVGVPVVNYNSTWQWWGEKPEGVKKTIQLAKAAGLKIMLKPQVYVSGSWAGGLEFDAKSWKKWETSYKEYINQFVDIAIENQVELFCIGTEFRLSIRQRPQFWVDYIKEIRKRYKGKLTYASNWDDFEDVPFWNDLDYIGVDAYFPVCDKTNPTISCMKDGWQEPFRKMKSLSKKIGKDVLFTECGYLSIDQCAYRGWELEKKVKQMPINQQAQADAYQALFEVFWEESWWAGAFWWKWFPENKGHEGYFDRDYTPQGKKAEKILRKWYAK